MEMIRFCATIHPTWGRVMARHRQPRSPMTDTSIVNFDGKLKECLLILEEEERRMRRRRVV